MTSPIHDAVRQHYAKRIDISSSCCADTCCSSESSLYPADLLAALPPDMAETSYGCGDPITLASLQPRQTVLDLGSGAGLDCLLASQKAGSSTSPPSPANKPARRTRHIRPRSTP